MTVDNAICSRSASGTSSSVLGFASAMDVRTITARFSQVMVSKATRKTRLGTPSPQWISVYNSRHLMKQRYHYNIVDTKLQQHINKGIEDGFFISCVASAENKWALIRDSATGFTSQVYELSPSFLHMDWIMKQRKENYYITSIAGADNGCSFVVMSQGTGYTQQRYKVSKSFPSGWINKKWKEGFYVTSMTTAASHLDHFSYPSEANQRQWKNGYKVTSMAATRDQAAFILSIPQRKLPYETQETLSTPAFPSTQVEEKWTKDLYLSSICYWGGTV